MGDTKEWVLTHVSVEEFMTEEIWDNVCLTVQDPYPAPVFVTR